MQPKFRYKPRQHGAMEFSEAPIDLEKLRNYRLQRLILKMNESDVAGLILFNQIMYRLTRMVSVQFK